MWVAAGPVQEQCGPPAPACLWPCHCTHSTHMAGRDGSGPSPQKAPAGQAVSAHCRGGRWVRGGVVCPPGRAGRGRAGTRQSPRERHRRIFSQHSNTFQGGEVDCCVKKYSFLVLLMWRSKHSADNPPKCWRRRPGRRAKQAQHTASWRRTGQPRPTAAPRSCGDPYRSWSVSSAAASTST